MSILRFRGGMGLDPDGQWVHYDDHRAEVERLTAEIARITEDRDSWETATGVNDALARGQLDAINLERQRDIARAEVERLTAERDRARAEVERLVFALQMAESSDREGHVTDSIPPNDPDWIFRNTEIMSRPEEAWRDASRPTDEDIWREAFMTMLPSYQWEKAAEQSDRVLAEYRKRWPR